MGRLGHLLPWGFVILLLGWAGYGIWPVTPVEGDEQGVLFGVAGMLQNDTLLLSLRYTYELQPGYYHLLAGLARLTGLAPEVLFAATTALGAVGFAVAGARLLQILLDWPLGWTLAAMLWCQEVTAAASYMNTSALAGAIALLAVISSRRPQRSAAVRAGVLLALSGWLRADSLLLAPACLGLAYWQEKQWRPVLLRTGIIASISSAGILVLYWLSGTSVFAGLGSYATRGYLHSGWRVLLESPVQLLSPALAAGCLTGSLLLMIRRQHALGLVVLSGVLASVGAYGASLTTPKYFYYLVPFALLPALVLVDGWRGRMQRRPWAAAGVLGAIALCDGLLGLRTMEPAQRLFTTVPTWATLGPVAAGTKNFSLVVGPGELIVNADAFRLRTGQLFAPGSWHREKQRVQTDLGTIRSWLEGGKPELTVYWANWLPLQLARRELLALGFRPTARDTAEPGATAAEVWRRGDQVVHFGYLGYAGSSYQPPGPAPASRTGADTYFIGDCARQPITELADGGRWLLLSAVPEGLITLHQRQ